MLDFREKECIPTRTYGFEAYQYNGEVSVPIDVL